MGAKCIVDIYQIYWQRNNGFISVAEFDSERERLQQILDLAFAQIEDLDEPKWKKNKAKKQLNEYLFAR